MRTLRPRRTDAHGAPYGGLLALCLLLLCSGALQAQGLLMARIPQGAEQVTEQAQALLNQRGYAVAHIQKCDGGMAEFGYESDFYRVIFFGKLEEVRDLVRREPAFAAYLPLKLLIFAEREETLAVAVDPLSLVDLFPDPKLRPLLEQWRADLSELLQELHGAR